MTCLKPFRSSLISDDCMKFGFFNATLRTNCKKQIIQEASKFSFLKCHSVTVTPSSENDETVCLCTIYE